MAEKRRQPNSLCADEKLACLNALSKGDRSRLFLAAQKMTWFEDHFEPEDLMQETLAVLLRDSVSWPDELDVMAVIREKMRGVAADLRKRREHRQSSLRVELSGDLADTIPASHFDHGYEDVRLSELTSELERWAAADQDSTVEIVLISKLLGEAKKDVMEEWGFSNQQYDAARRKIQRKVKSMIESIDREGKDE